MQIFPLFLISGAEKATYGAIDSILSQIAHVCSVVCGDLCRGYLLLSSPAGSPFDLRWGGINLLLFAKENPTTTPLIRL